MLHHNLIIDQALVMANNYYQTGQNAKAYNVLNTLIKIDPENEMAKLILDNIGKHPENIGLHLSFGKQWKGESLDGKTITVISDQGRGDTIQFLRFLKILKKWDCKIIFNYHREDEFKDLFACCDYIDVYRSGHLFTDYTINLFQIPPILSDSPKSSYKPFTEGFQDECEFPYIKIPESYKREGKYKIGVAWSGNSNNIDETLFNEFEASDREFHSLIPKQGRFIDHKVKNFLDVARIIKKMDAVISIDTAALHLAGAMGKPIAGLIHFPSDVRWENSDYYPSLSLFRQCGTLDWYDAIFLAKKWLDKTLAMC